MCAFSTFDIIYLKGESKNNERFFLSRRTLHDKRYLRLPRNSIIFFVDETEYSAIELVDKATMQKRTIEGSAAGNGGELPE